MIVGRGKNADPSFHLSIQQGQDIPLIYILGGFKVIGGTKTTIVLNPIVIDSTDEVKSLSKEQRKCGIPSDIEDDHPLLQACHATKILIILNFVSIKC